MSIKIGSTGIGSLYLGSTKIGAAYLGNMKVYESVDPYNPLGLPPFTIRCRFTDGVTPSITKVTGAVLDQVSASPNIWDITYENTVWIKLLQSQSNLLEVLGANTTGVTMMGSGGASSGALFLDCINLESVALFDTSSVTDMGHMFGASSSPSRNTKLTTVPLFDTSSVTNMTSMFHGCTSLTTVPLFDTSSVTNISNIFQDCYSLTTVPLFDTSSVNDMHSMFQNCYSLTTVPLLDTSNLITSGTTKGAYKMFNGCTSLTTVPLFNLAGCRTLTSMFEGCSSLTTVPLFNLASASRTANMFKDCANVESGALALYTQTSTQTTPPSSHSGMFTNCGIDTVTGAAELARIPSDWGGTGA